MGQKILVRQIGALAYELGRRGWSCRWGRTRPSMRRG